MFNFQLRIYPPYLNTDSLFAHGFPSLIQRSSSKQHSTHSFLSSCLTRMPLDPYEDHSDLEMDNLAKPNPILRMKRSIQSIRSLQATHHQQCPIMALPIDPQPTPMVPTEVSELSAPAS